MGRDLAPQLKAVIGPWLSAQNDLYAPAASAAESAFAVAFPAEKQASVLMFCKQEILQVRILFSFSSLCYMLFIFDLI